MTTFQKSDVSPRPSATLWMRRGAIAAALALFVARFDPAKPQWSVDALWVGALLLWLWEIRACTVIRALEAVRAPAVARGGADRCRCARLCDHQCSAHGIAAGED